jgi:hypothetical protein
LHCYLEKILCRAWAEEPEALQQFRLPLADSCRLVEWSDADMGI